MAAAITTMTFWRHWTDGGHGGNILSEMSISTTYVALAVASACSTFASHSVEVGALRLEIAVARPSRHDVALRHLDTAVAHERQAHRVVFRVRFVVKVAEVDVVAPVDVVVQIFVLFLVHLLRNGNLPRSRVQRRPQDLHGLLRVELYSEDLLDLNHLLL